MITVETATELRALLKRYIDAQAASTRAQEARARLQAGSTRARSTTANANWARAAEHRDRVKDAVETMLCELVRRPAACRDERVQAAIVVRVLGAVHVEHIAHFCMTCKIIAPAPAGTS